MQLLLGTWGGGGYNPSAEGTETSETTSVEGRNFKMHTSIKKERQKRKAKKKGKKKKKKKKKKNLHFLIL